MFESLVSKNNAAITKTQPAYGMSTSRDQRIALCCRVLWRRIEKSCSAELKGNRTCICSGLVRDWTPLRISHAISCSRSACLFCRLMRLDTRNETPVEVAKERVAKGPNLW